MGACLSQCNSMSAAERGSNKIIACQREAKSVQTSLLTCDIDENSHSIIICTKNIRVSVDTVSIPSSPPIHSSTSTNGSIGNHHDHDQLQPQRQAPRSIVAKVLSNGHAGYIHRRVQAMRSGESSHSSSLPGSVCIQRDCNSLDNHVNYATPTDSLQLPSQYALRDASLKPILHKHGSADVLQLPTNEPHVRHNSLLGDLWCRSPSSSRKTSRESTARDAVSSVGGSQQKMSLPEAAHCKSNSHLLTLGIAESLRHLGGNIKRCKSFSERGANLGKNRRKSTMVTINPTMCNSSHHPSNSTCTTSNTQSYRRTVRVVCQRTQHTNVGVECVVDVCREREAFLMWFHVKPETLLDENPAASRDPRLQVQGVRIQSFLQTLVEMLGNEHDEQQSPTPAEQYCHRLGQIHFLHGVPFTADNYLVFKQSIQSQYMRLYAMERVKSDPSIDDATIAFDRFLRFVIKNMKTGYLQAANPTTSRPSFELTKSTSPAHLNGELTCAMATPPRKLSWF